MIERGNGFAMRSSRGIDRPAIPPSPVVDDSDDPSRTREANGDPRRR
jgi:hypothetical protein